MGWLDIFGKKGPSSDAIAKQVRKAKEGYAQPDYRRMAMDQLLKWNTDESLRGLLDRFCVVVQSPHWDEEEKRWLVDEFVAIGDRMVPILRNFIFEKNEVNYALLAVQKIINDKKAYGELLIEALKRRPPSDHRSVQGKQEIIAAMMEQNNTVFEEAIMPHLADHSDDVQCLAVTALSKSERPDIRDRIIRMLSSDAHSARVVRAASAVVADQQWQLSEDIRLSDVVSEDFKIDHALLVRQ